MMETSPVVRISASLVVTVVALLSALGSTESPGVSPGLGQRNSVMDTLMVSSSSSSAIMSLVMGRVKVWSPRCGRSPQPSSFRP